MAFLLNHSHVSPHSGITTPWLSTVDVTVHGAALLPLLEGVTLNKSLPSLTIARFPYFFAEAKSITVSHGDIFTCICPELSRPYPDVITSTGLRRAPGNSALVRPFLFIDTLTSAHLYIGREGIAGADYRAKHSKIAGHDIDIRVEVLLHPERLDPVSEPLHATHMMSLLSPVN